MDIIVLAGGLSPERQVSLVSGQGICRALRGLGHRAVLVDMFLGLEAWEGEWKDIFDEDTRKALYKEQKASTTIVKEAKVYPNDPCPCGSGKKYKKCCGKK